MLVFVLLIGVVTLAWFRGPELWDFARGDTETAGEGRGAAVDEVLANEVMARFRRAIEEDSTSLSFSGREIEAVLRNRFTDRIPRGGSDPKVRFESGEVQVSARIPRDSLSLPSEMERGRALLPQQVPIELRGVLLSTASGPVFVVRRVQVGGLPVPRRISDRVIGHLRAGEEGSLPPSTLSIQLPPEAREVYIDGDRLVLGQLP